MDHEYIVRERFSALIRELNTLAERGIHPCDLHNLNKLMQATGRLAWCIEEQARPDESLSAEEREVESRQYILAAFEAGLRRAMKQGG